MLFLFPVDEDLGDEWEEDQYEDETETDTTVGDIKSPQTPGERHTNNQNNSNNNNNKYASLGCSLDGVLYFPI